MILDIIAQFRESMLLAGIKPPEIIYDDRKLHRFVINEKAQEEVGWYILYRDNISAGSFGNLQVGSIHFWHADIGRKLSEEEAVEYQKKIEEMCRARKAIEKTSHADADKQPETMGTTNTRTISSSHKFVKNPVEVKLVCAADLEPKPICWVWDQWLAAGKFHLLVGAPGTGKTTIGLNLAAIITCGNQWPDGTYCKPGNVLIWSGEDDPQDTLLPRLLAHGAEPQRIYFVSDVIENNKCRAFDPARDIPKLYDRASQIGEIQLILIDPIVNMISGDSHKNGEVRRALQPLVELGEKLKAVVLGISHFTKGTVIRDPLERINGSIAFGALARVVLATAKITDMYGQTKHVLVRTKSNYGFDEGGYYYQIKPIELANYPGIFSSQLIWDEPAEGNARELLAEFTKQDLLDERSTLREAMDFLKILLANGPIPKKEIDEEAKEAGFTDITLRRAKAFLGIETVHEGYGKGSIWKWCLPAKMLKESKDTSTHVNVLKNQEDLLSSISGQNKFYNGTSSLLQDPTYCQKQGIEDFWLASSNSLPLKELSLNNETEIEPLPSNAKVSVPELPPKCLGIGREDKVIASKMPSQSLMEEHVQQIFEHWKAVMNHPNARLDLNRRALIAKALNFGYGVEELCHAISGCSVTPHNMGHNEQNQRYDGLHVILRDSDQIDRFIHNYHYPPRPLSEAERKTEANVQSLQRWAAKKIEEECIQVKS